MKTENEENQTSSEMATALNTDVAPAVEAVSDEDFQSELSKPIWSVISFEKCEAVDLSYSEAIKKMQELGENNFFGLCVVTNMAAQKIKGKNSK